MTKKKLNAIDIGVIAIIAIVIIAATLLLIPKGDKADPIPTDTEKLESQIVVMEVKEKSETFCNAINKGDVVKDPSNMKEIGSIKEIERVPSTAYTVSSNDASFVKATVPDRYDLYITVELTASREAKRIGTGLAIRGKKYICQGYIVDVIKGKETTK